MATYSAKVLRFRQALRPLVADATFAVFVGLFTAMVLTSLSIAGLITLKGAALLLVAAWFIGITSTFFIDHVWPITSRHRLIVGTLLAFILTGIGCTEYYFQPVVSSSAQATENFIKKPSNCPVNTAFCLNGHGDIKITNTHSSGYANCYVVQNSTNFKATGATCDNTFRPEVLLKQPDILPSENLPPDYWQSFINRQSAPLPFLGRQPRPKRK